MPQEIVRCPPLSWRFDRISKPGYNHTGCVGEEAMYCQVLCLEPGKRQITSMATVREPAAYAIQAERPLPNGSVPY